MLRWDQKFLTKLRKLGITSLVYTRYVDDTLIVTEATQPGVRYKSGKLIWLDPKDDNGKNDDQRTFALLRNIADSIDKDIQWEEDVASNHESGYLPCLDMQVKMSKEHNRVEFQFYKKSMSSKFLILNRSAISDSTKRSTIFQEGMRRLMNCAPFLDWKTKVKHLSDFSHAMLISGYNHQFRHDIISGVITRYNQISSSVSDGTREWYRSKCQIKEDKQRKGGNNAATWHLKGDTRHTLAVPITPTQCTS